MGRQSLSSEDARLRWRCRRGMRELDALLEAFLARDFEDLDSEEKGRLAVILDLPDPELHAYLIGSVQPTEPGIADLILRIRASVGTET